MNNPKKLIRNLFKLDKIDMTILSGLQKHPEATCTEIAKKVDKSQPTVGIRIKRLKEKGLLKKMYGIDFRNVNLVLAHVSIQTSDIYQLTKRINVNIGKLLVWSTSGKYNLNLLICGENVKYIGNMVNTLFKNEKCIKLIKFEIINDLLTEFILPLKM